MSYWCGFSCIDYVEWGKCSGNTSSLRLFTHKDNLPDSSVINQFDNDLEADPEVINCWTLDPADDLVCVAPGGIIVVPNGDMETCEACEAEADEDESNTAGTTDPGFTPNIIDVFWKADLCAGSASKAAALGMDVDKLYVFVQGNKQPAAGIMEAGQICLDIPEDPTKTTSYPSDAAVFYDHGERLDNCSDCTDGYIYDTGCPDVSSLPQYSDLPKLFIRKGETAPSVIEYQGLCLQRGSLQTIPDDGKIINPESSDCASCGLGQYYTICPGQAAAEKTYYAKQSQIDDLKSQITADGYTVPSTVTVKIDGICHTLPLLATAVAITITELTEARRPTCGYVDCSACLCDGQLVCGPLTGVPVYPCSIGAAIGNVWIAEDDIPADPTVFEWNDKCYFANPATPVTDIPEGSKIATVDSVYPDCLTCLGFVIGITPPENDFCQQFPFLCGDGDQPDQYRYFQPVFKCVFSQSGFTLEPTTLYTRVEEETPIYIRYRGECYTRQGELIKLLTGIPGKLIDFATRPERSNCIDCEPYYRIDPCDDSLDAVYAPKGDLELVTSPGNGVVDASDGHCYNWGSEKIHTKAGLEAAGETIVGIVDAFEECCDCDPSLDGCEEEETPCDECDASVIPTTYICEYKGCTRTLGINPQPGTPCQWSHNGTAPAGYIASVERVCDYLDWETFQRVDQPGWVMTVAISDVACSAVGEDQEAGEYFKADGNSPVGTYNYLPGSSEARGSVGAAGMAPTMSMS